jgi:hypothetical protein
MLKTVSSITNAIGALNFKGTWDASANSPVLTSSAGTKGDYYVVGTAGATNLNGISNWGIGDLATFNGAVWQRVEGGADLNGVNLSVSGTSALIGSTGMGTATPTTKLHLSQSNAGDYASVVLLSNSADAAGDRAGIYGSAPVGNALPYRGGITFWPGASGAVAIHTGNNAAAGDGQAMYFDGNSPRDVTVSTGNLVIGTSGKGIDFSADGQAAGMTSELLNDYEEGTWTPTVAVNTGTATGYTIEKSVYTKIGREVTAKTEIIPTGGTFGDSLSYCQVNGLPFQPSGNFAGSMGNSANYTLNEDALAFTSGANTNIGIMAGILISVGNRATLQVTYFV